MKIDRPKELRAQRAKLVEDARALIAGDSPNAETTAKFDTMMAEADVLKGQIDRLEKADADFAALMEGQRPANRSGAAVVGADDVHAKMEFAALDMLARKDAQALSPAGLDAWTFGTWMRRGTQALNAEQRPIFEARFKAALGEGVDTSGGYTVPQGFFTRMIDAEKAYGGMLDVATVFDTATGADLPIPTDNDTTNAGAILGENVQVGTQDITFGAVVLHAYTYTSKLVLVSNQLLQDSAFPLDAWLADRLGVRIARIVNTHCTTGDGAAKPAGIVGAAPNSATLGYTAGGTTTSGSTATIAYDDLIELEHSVDPAYRKAAQFMMSDAALKVIKKLKDGQGRPLWLPGLAMKEPDTINDKPYVINQDMAAPAASAKSVAFGDFSNYYMRRVAGVQLLRLVERYADYNQVGFLAFQRFDGTLVDAGTHPVTYLQQSAS